MASRMRMPTEEPITPSPRAPRREKLRVGRRAFLVTAATVGVCGAGALAAPQVLPALETHLQDAGRTAVLDELGTLEGVSLDAALRAAEITQAAVKILVLPVAHFVSAVGAGALNVLLSALGTARNALALLHLPTAVLDAFRAVVVSWQAGITSLPIALNAYATADIASAETYLRALKQMATRPHSA